MGFTTHLQIGPQLDAVNTFHGTSGTFACRRGALPGPPLVATLRTSSCQWWQGPSQKPSFRLGFHRQNHSGGLAWPIAGSKLPYNHNSLSRISPVGDFLITYFASLSRISNIVVNVRDLACFPLSRISSRSTPECSLPRYGIRETQLFHLRLPLILRYGIRKGDTG